MSGENATLTAITVPGSVDAYGDPSSNTSAWTGSVKGYLKRPRIERTGTDLEEDRKIDTFVANAASARTLIAAVVAGADAQAATVTIIDRRQAVPVTNTYRVKGLELIAAGTPADSVRLVLRREEP
jgi:hypothetical protein